MLIPWLPLWLCLLFAPAVQDRPGGVVPPSAYLASSIPDSLSGVVRAVVRYEESNLRVFDVRRAEYHVRRIVTVLRPEGKDFGELTLPYDRFRTIAELNGTLYDSQGKEVRSLGNDDVADYPATSDYSLYDDNRVKMAAIYSGTIPYTVEYSYVFRFDGYLGWPGWSPQEERAAVEQSTFTVTLPEQMNLRAWSYGAGVPAVRTDGPLKTYSWEAKGLAPFEAEPYASSEEDRPIRVVVSPEQFEIDGHAGDMSSWEAFGRWFAALTAGKQELPAEVSRDIGALLKGAAARRDTVRMLYGYLQSHTRYVSVQLGIGGWQPFDASYVHERGYGDCKALTNYMKALLEAAGIASSYALISNGLPAVNDLRDFPSQRFNHVILCVPDGKDSIWLECTSQDSPFGHLGAGNESRYALLIGPEGGSLVSTPSSAAGDNRQARVTTLRLDRKGNATAEARTSYSGNQQDYVRAALLKATPEERERWIRESVDLPSFTLRSADYSGMLPRAPEVTLRIAIDIPRYASSAGKRLIFNPNLMEHRTSIPKAMEKREFPLRFGYPYVDVDTVHIHIPEGYAVEGLAKPVELRTDFGSFRSEVSAVDDSTLLLTRRLELAVRELPAVRYAEYREFIGKVVFADKAVASVVIRP
jgi:transglutaminase-like putative cysteine protease